MRGIIMDIEEKRNIMLGAKEWVKANLPITLKIQNESYGKLLIHATIDCFAQMCGNYPPSNFNSDTFCRFVLRYSSYSKTFQQICPTTLHYHYDKENDIKLTRGRIYQWDDPELVEEANRILHNIKEEQLRKTAQKKHTYIKLLYQQRNKLVHELDNIGTKIEFSKDVPSIASGKDISSSTIWTLNYPKLWLYNLAQETIYNFIEDCMHNEKPLRFLDKERTTNLTWYI